MHANVDLDSLTSLESHLFEFPYRILYEIEELPLVKSNAVF